MVAKVKDLLLSIPRHILVLQLTVIFLLLHDFTGNDLPALSILITLVGIFMILHQDALKNKYLWGFIFLVMVAVIVVFLSTMDNHKYLIAYWCLACCVSLGTDDPDRFMAKNARYLIGLAFFFAFIWKILGGEYIDGAFFQGTFFMDDRFWLFTQVMTGLTEDSFGAIEDLLMYFEIFPNAMGFLVLPVSGLLKYVSMVFSYWTLFIELVIAVSFLWFSAADKIKGRDCFLILFLLTTYVLAPVDSFAMILCIMGLAQLAPSQARMRLAYIFVFFLFQLWDFVPELKDLLMERMA